MQECGWPAYAVLFFALVAFVAAIAALAMAALRARHAMVAATLALALALAVAAAALGPMGTFLQQRKVDEILATESIDPSAKARIFEAGYAEAAQCTNLGLGFGALPLVLASVAIALAFARRPLPE